MPPRITASHGMETLRAICDGTAAGNESNDDRDDDRGNEREPHAIHLVPFFALSCLSRCGALDECPDEGRRRAFRLGILRGGAMAVWMDELPRTARDER